MDLIQQRTVRTEKFESGSASQMSMAPATLRACLNCIFIWTNTHLMSFGHLMLLVCVLACPWVPEYSHFRLPYCIASLAIESPWFIENGDFDSDWELRQAQWLKVVLQLMAQINELMYVFPSKSPKYECFTHAYGRGVFLATTCVLGSVWWSRIELIESQQLRQCLIDETSHIPCPLPEKRPHSIFVHLY